MPSITPLGSSRTPAGGAPAVIAHLFKRTRSGSYCLSADRSGARIPMDRDSDDWCYVKDVELVPGDDRLAIDTNAALSDLQERGYHLVGPWYPTL
jgi:hypothetical protein